MDRTYVYNKVHSLVAVFVAFEVLNDEDKKKKTRKGKDKAMDQRKGWKRIFNFNNIVKELAIKDSGILLNVWCEWVMPIFNEYWATSNRILLENKSLVGKKLFLRKKD